MTSPDLFARMFEFHRWRVEQVVAELGALPDATLDAPINGSFATLRKLIQHVVWVDQLWVARVRGEANPPMAPVEALGWAELLTVWTEQALKWRHLVEGLTEVELERLVSYRSAATYMSEHPGFEHTLADLLFQAQDHAGYHLGQLAYGLRQLGIKPMSVGYAAWLWR
jgi:uncharacterized damage-inducible protein DinB